MLTRLLHVNNNSLKIPIDFDKSDFTLQSQKIVEMLQETKTKVTEDPNSIDIEWSIICVFVNYVTKYVVIRDNTYLK